MATGTIKKTVEEIETATYKGKGLTMKCYRRGNVVTAYLEAGSASSSISAGATILTIGERFIPCAKHVFLAAIVTAPGTNTIRMTINTDGTVATIGTAISSGEYPRFTETYIAKD